MDYPFELLTDEAFQEFAQSLLLHDFPDIKCFPVGQPDGGRDATRSLLTQLLTGSKKSQWVYQVKFVRDPAIPDSEEWANEIFEKELAKIEELKRRGCERYILVTNARGSSHLDAGSIDKLAKKLATRISIPVEILWRHDLSRRLDNAWSLKWLYPVLMQGPDFLRAIFEGAFTPEWERRYDAIRAFLKDQFNRDIDVRFKQIDLKTALLDLYVDVPVTPGSDSGRYPRQGRSINRLAACYNVIQSRNGDASPTSDVDVVSYNERYVAHGNTQIDASEFLFSPLTQRIAPAIVLEGAPGQGKSTIAQYICQRYRIQFLEQVNKSTASQLAISLRLPIKIDLRDYAVWLSKKDPFDKKSDDIPQEWDRSIESFAAALIRYHSGGFRFSVEDFVSVGKRSALLIVFDGLDEVADIKLRELIVSEISRGYSRLSENAASVQVIVTSRPAAFINAPVLPKEHFEKLILSPLSKTHILAYVKKWQIAKGLNSHDISQLNQIIDKRLEEPHLRELARNPMQLAILLNLMHTRGASLPDKRTALYDSYVDLFFDREAEKSDTVREHRDLLVNIHRFLAWNIHINSEAGESTGRVSEPQMKTWLREYLAEEGHNPLLLDELFLGMVERVVAIVSRVEGTYEFEVQPLREYFTARFLYETAPYSPPGRERSGTKSDRFYAVARNFYWLNVTRFFAGCFSKGELLALIEKLEELISDPDFGLLSHPRLLAFTFLSDWVFSQHPRSVGRVVDLVTTDSSLRFLLFARGQGSERSQELALPDRCGKKEFVAKSLQLLGKGNPLEFSFELIELVRENISVVESKAVWLKMDIRTSERDDWLEFGFRLGALGSASFEELRPMLIGNPISSEQILVLFFAKQTELLSKVATPSAICQALMKRGRSDRSYSRATSLFELLYMFSSPWIFSQIHSTYTNGTPTNSYQLRDVIKNLPAFNDLMSTGDTKLDQGIMLFVSTVLDEGNKGIIPWRSTLIPWKSLVGACAQIGDNTWIERFLANIGAGIKSKTETGMGGEIFFDHTVNRAIRYRFARLRAGQSHWWQNTILGAKSIDNSIDVLIVFFTWASTNVIREQVAQTEKLLADLSVEEYGSVFDAIRNVWLSDARREDVDIEILRKLGSCSLRAWYLIAPRTIGLARSAFIDRPVTNWANLGRSCCQFAQDIATAALNNSVSEAAVEMLVSCFKGGAISDPNRYGHAYRRQSSHGLALTKAKEILLSPTRYPKALLVLSEEKMRSAIAKEIPRIGEVAKSEVWFEHTKVGK